MKRKTHSHVVIVRGCQDCETLRAHWYTKIRAQGFTDIEYGQPNPRFTAHQPDPNQPGASESARFYELAWQVFHQWSAQGRQARDLMVAELFAAQENHTGTVRGISKALKAQGMAPWSTSAVQVTVREIRELIRQIETKPENTAFYVSIQHKAA